MDISEIRSMVRDQKYDLSSHAHLERQNETITISEIETAILKGGIIEKYSKDPRGESCLVVGRTSKGKYLHVVCGSRGKRLLIVTVYRPKSPTWIDFKTRRKELKKRG